MTGEINKVSSVYPFPPVLEAVVARSVSSVFDEASLNYFKQLTDIKPAFSSMLTSQLLRDQVDVISRTKFAGVATVPLAVEDEAAIRAISQTTVRVMAKSAGGEKWFGSGSIVDPRDVVPDYIAMPGEYFIITNHHVANDAKFLSVRLSNGNESWAEVVESPRGAKLMDELMDVAIMRIHIPQSIPTAIIGNPRALSAGQTIYTAGYSRALPKLVVTKGIVSQPLQDTGNVSEDIQNDAPINPGNSGGPLFNERGEVVGTNTYTLRDGEDMSFAKPIDTQLGVVNEIWNKDEVTRGAFYFEVKPFSLIDRKDAFFPEHKTGAMISSVKRGSEADRAGVMVNDVVTEIHAYGKDGRVIRSLQVNVTDKFESSGIISRFAATLEPGTEVRMVLYRKILNIWMPMELKVKVEKLAKAVVAVQ